ncbi:Arginase family protein [Butyrivibrio proteoclasticus]|uniref:Arginase family protein n=1 Tax=Butyrivibrio proteoclasticus TaxID=43305 RepID=A0A1I5XLD2_9FIRM|nr:arginase family protein [Butyrivibrio proteoclasticus]SFQ32781.1 Arginase family protein [Butyrivibrio proteoclasticus]
MKAEFTVFNFSGIYDKESFYRRDKGSSFCGKVLDLKDISGTNCLCDDGTMADIKKVIADAESVHFIDSGNYHYMSALMLEMVKEPFSLVVLDHHPDMQPSMFGDILSCGSWVKDVLDNNPNVRDVHIIGADRKLVEELDESDRHKVHFYDREEVVVSAIGSNSCEQGFVIKLPETDYPVYFSLDKDIIAKECLETNWDQGEFADLEVLEFTRALLKEKNVIGVDICGECALDQEGIDFEKEVAKNDQFNRAILELIITNHSVNVN